MRKRGLLGAAAVVCLAAALACFTQAWRASGGQRHLVPFQAATAQPQPHATTPPAAVPAAVPVPASAAPPVKVVIPAVGLSARVVPVGVDTAGHMEMPAPTLVGWYKLGPAPGALGPAVLVGHVDTYTGPAVFWRLTGVRPGDKVQVLRADGSWASFVITKVTTVNKATFPSQAVFGPTAGAAIRLITCTGPFNPASGHYLDSLIAWGQQVT